LLRFLFGGLATVAGIVLLFVASFGDPAAVLHWAQTTLPFVGPSQSNDVTAETQPQSAPPAAVQNPAPPAVSDTQKAQTQPAMQPQIEAQVQTPPQPKAQTSPPPASPSPPEASAAANSAPPADAGMQAQRAALQQELQKLQAETEQAAQSVVTLRHQASQERQDLDALQQEHAAEQQEVNRLHAAQAKVAAVKAEVAQTQKPPASPTQATASQTPPQTPPAPAASQTSLAPAVAQSQPASQPAVPAQPAAPVQTAEAGNPDLPLPPPVAPPPPPLPRPRVPVQTAANYPGGRPSPDDYARQTDQGQALQSVIARLRQHYDPAQAPNAGAPPSYASAQSPYAGYQQPGPPSEPAAAQRRAYGQPAPPGPRRHLGMARAALIAGNIDAARQYLEEAQLQLVFRPVTPTDNDPSGGSRVAGEVASALNMLGAGDTNGALEYVDRAMAEVDPASAPEPAPPPQYYGYAGGYGGPQQ